MTTTQAINGLQKKLGSRGTWSAATVASEAARKIETLQAACADLRAVLTVTAQQRDAAERRVRELEALLEACEVS